MSARDLIVLIDFVCVEAGWGVGEPWGGQLG